MFSEINLTDLILSKLNVRKCIDTEDDETTIKNLAESIHANGLINPLTVKKNGNVYEIIAGHRRYLALKGLGIKSVMCNIIDMEDEQAEIISFIENNQRTKMSQRDKCNFFHKLFYMCDKSVTSVAKITGFSHQVIKDYLFLNENLSSELFEKLDARGESKLSMQIALLLSKTFDKNKQFLIYELICPLGTTEMKKQFILNYLKEEEEEEDIPENEESKEKPSEKKEQEEKIKIPKKPWVFDENGKPLLIPEVLYPEICTLIKNN